MLRINNVPVSSICPLLDKTKLNPQLYSDDGIHFYTKPNDRKLSLKEEFSIVTEELFELQEIIVNRIAIVREDIKKQGPEEYRFLMSIYNKLKKIV